MRGETDEKRKMRRDMEKKRKREKGEHANR